jgi:hypothetical protein
VTRLIILLCSVGLAASTMAAGQKPASRTFDEDGAGAAPEGFTFAATRQQASGTWIVRSEGSGHILVHPADMPPQRGFALAVLGAIDEEDLTVSVRLKLAAGDRSAGLVWRYQDPDNYYVARLNLDRQYLAVYRVVDGNVVRFAAEDDLELDPDAWYTLKVTHEGPRLRVYLGGIRVLDRRDRTFRQGGVGLWSTSGSTAWFDDLRVERSESRRR